MRSFNMCNSTEDGPSFGRNVWTCQIMKVSEMHLLMKANECFQLMKVSEMH